MIYVKGKSHNVESWSNGCRNEVSNGFNNNPFAQVENHLSQKDMILLIWLLWNDFVLSTLISRDNWSNANYFVIKVELSLNKNYKADKKLYLEMI